MVLPYADLVLISTNSITAIAYNTFLSICFLGEKFIWKYDMPAFAFMGLGSITILFLASTSDKEFTHDQIYEMLTARQSLIMASIVVAFLVGTLVYTHIFLNQITRFDEDLDVWTK